MSIELVHQGAPLDLLTGEYLDLATAELEALAEARDALGQLYYQRNEAIALIDDEFARRMDAENERSVTAGDYLVKINAPQEIEWDLDRLRHALDELVDEGRLAAGARSHALVPTTIYKPAYRELTKLLGHADPMVRDRIEQCRQAVPQKRRATVTRSATPKPEEAHR